MRILGIDPGTGRTGFGVIDVDTAISISTPDVKSLNSNLTDSNLALCTKLVTFGCIETPKEDIPAVRLVTIRKAIKKLLSDYKPDAASVELLFHGPNAKTVMAVGQARGVILEAVAGENIPTFDYQGLSIKKIISGSGKSDKKQMQEIIKDFFGLETVPKPDDAADGLAIALCHALTVAEQITKTND